jgi:hypothetical protein
MLILSTCWFSLGAKFKDETYYNWMDNMLSTVQNYFLVVYTDALNAERLQLLYGNNTRIYIVKCSLEETVMYNRMGKSFWIQNHHRNELLKTKVHWAVNLIWCEKVFWVERTAASKFFYEPPNTWYGWIDIGYFRCRPSRDVPRDRLSDIPTYDILERLNREKIHYVQIEERFIETLYHCIAQNRPFPDHQLSFAGGCFLLFGAERVTEWRELFWNEFKHYVYHHKTHVKDDQIIVASCILKYKDKFCIHTPPKHYRYDPWFLFTSILLGEVSVSEETTKMT